MSTMSSREFNRDTAAAKRAAAHGPVYITDRGRPAHVLLTIDAFTELADPRRIIKLLGQPAGVENVELQTPRLSDPPTPASFD